MFALLFVFSSSASELPLKIPLLELPTNLENNGHWPGMLTSQTVAEDLHLLVMGGHMKWAEQAKSRHELIWLHHDIAQAFLFLADGWMHEEWHRAVLAKHEISSVNNMLNPAVVFSGNGLVDVDGLLDSELSALKQNAPADMVRMSLAGMEGQQELVHNLVEYSFFQEERRSKKKFFGQVSTSKLHTDIIFFLNQANNFMYMNACATGGLEDQIAELERVELTQRSRDFTGADCNAWVYDLFRPNEPYENRGPHSSGDGIDRYIDLDEMSEEEQDFLTTAYWSQMLNFIHPMTLNFDGWEHSDGIWAINLRHAMIPFGVSYDVEGRWTTSNGQYTAALRNGIAQSSYHPTVEFEWRKLELGTFGFGLQTALWWQPEDLLFTTTKGKLGGSIAFKNDFTIAGNWDWSNHLVLKTQGFQYGALYMERNASLFSSLIYRWQI